MLRRLAGETIGAPAPSTGEGGGSVRVELDDDLAPLWLLHRLVCDPENRLLEMRDLINPGLTLDHVDRLDRGAGAIGRARAAASKGNK